MVAIVFRSDDEVLVLILLSDHLDQTPYNARNLNGDTVRPINFPDSKCVKLDQNQTKSKTQPRPISDFIMAFSGLYQINPFDMNDAQNIDYFKEENFEVDEEEEEQEELLELEQGE